MKKLLLFLIFLNSCNSFSQENVFGNSPATGVIPIKRMDTQTTDINAKKVSTQTTSLTPSTPTGSSSEVGVTEGQLEVSLTGSATYNIPIAVPAGINGVIPQIALSYNSQGGNGLAGFGWNITGISSITRIPATKFHDNTIDAIDFNNLDKYAFDGQRLVIKNGTSGVYGANGTVYETESFSNVQITSYGVHPSGANYGPAYFIVQYPDGSIAHYGNSTTSRSLTDWAITYWQNPQGVRISYNYVLSNNNLSISTIKYGTRLTTTPINEIAFVYLPRQRTEQAYIGGQSFVRNTILSQINVKGNNVGFRNYLLTHETTSLGYERLKSITEKSGDNTKSYNPTIFNYDTTTNSDLFQISNPITLNVNSINFTNSSNVSGDFDGDGNMDFILYPTTGTDAKRKYWLYTNIEGSTLNIGSEHNLGYFLDIFPTSWLSWNNKLMPMQGWCAVQTNSVTNTTTFNNYSTGTVNPIYFQYSKTFQFPKFTFSYWTEPCDTGGVVDPNIGLNRLPDPFDDNDPVYNEIIKDIPKEYLSGDFNGDGLTDVIIVEKPVIISYFTGGCNGSNTTYTSIGGKSYFLDLDRRITTDYINIAGYLQVTSNSKFTVADVNGDGKSDLMIFDSGSVKTYFLNDNKQLVQSINFPDTSILSDKPRYMGDFNGDGKIDFVIPQADNKDSWSFFFSKGNSFQKVTTSIGFPFATSVIGYFGVAGFSLNTQSLQEVAFVANDINGDGKTDIILQGNYTCYAGGGCANGTPQVTLFRVFENKGFNGTSITFNQVYVNAQVGGINRYPMPLFLDHNNLNQNLEYGLISGNSIRTFKSTKDNRRDTRLKEIVLGSGVKEVITYVPLNSSCDLPYNCDIPFEPSTYMENYPNFDLKVVNSYQVVSKIEQVSANQSKQQKFKYYGAVSNLEGLGFLGFRGLAKTNWYNQDYPVITSVSKHDITKRGAIIETYTVLGETSGNFSSYTPSNFINKTNMSYADQLLTNKVFKINNPSTISTNGLDGTSKEVSTTYDVNNNPLTTTSISKNGTTAERTEVINIEYFPSTISPTYIVGRVKKKNSSVTHNGDTMTGEEIYTYNTDHLVSKIQKKGHLTNYLTEDNIYDVFGNITQKKITAVGLTPRITNFTYDTTGRFLLTSIDIEGLTNTYTYNTSNGLLLTHTLPSNAGFPLTTTYLYDVWGKKVKETDYLGKNLKYTYLWLSAGSNGFFTTGITGDDNSSTFFWYDDLGRKIADGFRTINDASSSESNNSWKTYEYDIYDRVKKSYEPKLSLLPQWTGLFNATTYDAYGRITQVVEQTGKTSNINYIGLTTNASDGVSNTTSIKNSIGNVISMTDNGGTINYQYFANGNLKQSNFGGVIVDVEQDGWGRKTKLIDPSAGTYEYQYNEFGEIKKEITPKGETSYLFDNFGKVTEKTIAGTGGDPTNTKTTYTYNATTKLLSNVRYDDFTGGFYTLYSYGYDNYKRMNFNDESGFNAYYQKATQFDAFGRPEKELYSATNTMDMKSSNKWVKNTYKNGHHWQILDDTSSQVLWQTSKVNAKGQLLSANYGNGISVTNTYDQYGFPTQFKHDKTTAPLVNVMTLNTTFAQQQGNLTYRYNSMFDYREDFTYDNLNRLTSWKETGEMLCDCNFNANLQGFQTVNAASVSWSSNQLNVSGVVGASGKGTEKLVISNAAIGKKINIKGKLTIATASAGTTVHISFYSKNPTTGATVGYTTLGMPIGNGNFSYGTTIGAGNLQDLYVMFLMRNPSNPSAFMALSLDDIKITMEEEESQTYDALGRIDDNNLGSYNYTNTPKPFQNTSVELNSDAANYYLSRANLDITYNAFKSPINIIEDGKDKLSFIYNMNNSRSTMYYGSLEADKLSRRFRKHYSTDGSMEIKQDMVNGTVEFITYIGGDGYTAPVVLKSDGTTQQYLYLHRDYLGSIVAVTNQSSTVVEKRLFDAWGNITRVQDSNGNNLIGLTVIERGYTGHEHLQGVNLIHMNARLYDPIVHRFLQPDNFVQDPLNTQNFNRYSYVLNNPLKFTDASGEFAWIPVIIGAVIGAYSGGVIANGGELNPTKWELNIKTLGYIIGGAIVGGVTGGVSNGIATSGVAFANTKALLVGSIINGMGTHIYTGGKTDVTLSFGFSSLNFTTGEFGYLFKKGNSFMETVGYTLGAIANFNDIMAGFNTDNISNVELVTEHSDAIGHSAIVKTGTKVDRSIISFGPEEGGFSLNPFEGVPGDPLWSNHITDKSPIWRTSISGINIDKIYGYALTLFDKTPKYNLYFMSCVTATSSALIRSGFFNIGLHPYILAGQAYLRDIGFRTYLSHYLIKKQ
jgi:RHS repeat-associated protein